MYTGNEMGDELLLRSDRSKSSEGYEDSELTSFLNRAQYSYLISVLSGINPKMDSFEENELRSQGLSELIENYNTTTFDNNFESPWPNNYLVTLPSDFWLPIAEKVTIDQTDCVTGFGAGLEVVPISHNEFNLQEKNPYRKPYFKNNEGLVWRMVYNRDNDGNTDSSARTVKRAHIFANGAFSPTYYFLRYLKNPPQIVVDFTTTSNQRNCVLDSDVQENIIDIAVRMLKTASDVQETNNLQSFEKLS